MVSRIVEDLKREFHVRHVKDRGPCIVIPKGKFNAEWENALRAEGVGIDFNVDLPGGNQCTVLRLRPEHLEERVVYEPNSSPAKGLDQWKPEEDEIIIRLWNQKRKKREIHAELRKTFPNRTERAVIMRLARLKQAGKIASRWHLKREQTPPSSEPIREDFDYKMKHSKKIIEFARQLASMQVQCYSTRDIAEEIEKKFGVKVSHVTIADWISLSAPTPSHTPTHTATSEEISDLPELVKLIKEIRDLLKPGDEGVYFESFCPDCCDRRSVQDSNVWKNCPICGGPLIIWNVEAKEAKEV